ncbi:HAD family phosphatase [Sesbania bispinosa]|nr:HAD family phosphatase [Sesbania bispinosa]
MFERMRSTSRFYSSAHGVLTDLKNLWFKDAILASSDHGMRWRSQERMRRRGALLRKIEIKAMLMEVYLRDTEG